MAGKGGLMFKTVLAATAALVITVIPAQAQTGLGWAGLAEKEHTPQKALPNVRI